MTNQFLSLFLSPPKADWSHEVVDLCEEFRNRNVVGLDIAGDEGKGEVAAIKEHVKAFQVKYGQNIKRLAAFQNHCYSSLTNETILVHAWTVNMNNL